MSIIPMALSSVIEDMPGAYHCQAIQTDRQRLELRLQARTPVEQHRLKRISLLLEVLLLIEVTCAGSRMGSNVAATIGELTPADVARLAEVEQVLAGLSNEI